MTDFKNTGNPESFGVVVLSYNHPGITEKAVESVLRMGVEPSRIWLVHNGSQDRFVRGLQEHFGQIQHLILKDNLGFSGGANRGISQVFEVTDSSWVIFLSNDCQLKSLPDLGGDSQMIGPKVQVRDTSRIDSMGGGLDLRQGRLVHFREAGEFENTKLLRFINGSAFAIHRTAWRAVGGFDESFGTYWEDVKLSIELDRQGHRLWVDPNWEVRHGVGKTCQSDSWYTLYQYQRNRRRLSWHLAGQGSTPWLTRSHLAFTLARDWFRLSVKLLRSGRGQDLRLLGRAIFS